MVKEIYGRQPGDPMMDLDVILAIWGMFMNTTHRAAVHLGKYYDMNLRFVKNHFWETAGAFQGNRRADQWSDRNHWHKLDQFPRMEVDVDMLIAQSTLSIFHCQSPRLLRFRTLSGEDGSHFGSRPFLAQTSLCSRERGGGIVVVNHYFRRCQLFLFVSAPILHGEDRRWVLEDKIQQAVWQTVLRGPRPPSNRWTKSNAFATQNALKNKTPEVKVVKHPGQTSTPPRVSLPPEEAQEAARKRVVKLRAVLDTLGEDNETYPTIKAALQKAEVQAQERPISEQTRITKMFISRKQKKVEQTRLETEKAKESLSRAQTEQVEQEALSADGERRLEALLAKEKVLPSPFTVPQPAITPNVQAEFSRLQGIDSLQQELAHLRCGEHLSHTLPDDDDDMVADLPHKKTKVGPQTPSNYQWLCAENTSRNH